MKNSLHYNGKSMQNDFCGKGYFIMDGIKIPPLEEFMAQMQLHYQVRDGLHELVSDFETHQQEISAKLNTDQIGHYEQWWQNLRTCILQQATLHDQLGQSLKDAGYRYHDTDHQVAQNITNSAP